MHWRYSKEELPIINAEKIQRNQILLLIYEIYNLLLQNRMITHTQWRLTGQNGQ